MFLAFEKVFDISRIALIGGVKTDQRHYLYDQKNRLLDNKLVYWHPILFNIVQFVMYLHDLRPVEHINLHN